MEKGAPFIARDTPPILQVVLQLDLVAITLWEEVLEDRKVGAVLPESYLSFLTPIGRRGGSWDQPGYGRRTV